MKKRNSLPFYTGSAQEFLFDSMQESKALLSSKSYLLRRVFWEKGIRVTHWKDKSGAEKWAAIGYGKSIRFRDAMPTHTLEATRIITNDKSKTKDYLDSFGITTPRGKEFKTEEVEKILTWYDGLDRKKVVVKPVSGSSGIGVTASIYTREELLEALKIIETSRCVIEQHVEGEDHRLLVIGGKLVAAIKRYPAYVKGDGKTTVKQLVKLKNESRKRLPYVGSYPIVVDDTSLQLLEKKDMTENSIPSSGEVVNLKTVANVGAGGESEEILNLVHPEFALIAERCWAAFPDMSHCGVDLLAEDISLDPGKQSWAVIEINANCDLPMHHFPVTGRPIDVAGALVDYLFPNIQEKKVISIKALIEGKVVAVGFRKYLLKNAVLTGVKGYCKNVDGTHVEAIFEGSEVAVEEMIRISSMGSAKGISRSIEYHEVEIKNFSKFTIIDA